MRVALYFILYLRELLATAAFLRGLGVGALIWGLSLTAAVLTHPWISKWEWLVRLSSDGFTGQIAATVLPTIGIFALFVAPFVIWMRKAQRVDELESHGLSLSLLAEQPEVIPDSPDIGEARAEPPWACIVELVLRTTGIASVSQPRIEILDICPRPEDDRDLVRLCPGRRVRLYLPGGSPVVNPATDEQGERATKGFRLDDGDVVHGEVARLIGGEQIEIARDRYTVPFGPHGGPPYSFPARDCRILLVTKGQGIKAKFWELDICLTRDDPEHPATLTLREEKHEGPTWFERALRRAFPRWKSELTQETPKLRSLVLPAVVAKGVLAEVLFRLRCADPRGRSVLREALALFPLAHGGGREHYLGES